MPELCPEGTFGELGGVFITTDIGLDHPEFAPLLSVAMALTRYVPPLLQV
jgi:hypothetical protein